jgi:hypothetical protein
VYEPRSAAETVLHAVVRAHLEQFLAATASATDGAGVPRFIEREFRDFLGCGDLRRGFCRVRCDGCAFERLIPFSCKARAICPSCGGRRMAEQAARLVDAVLPFVPVRQWVLTVPHRLRYRLAFDHVLCRAVLAVLVRVVLGWYRRRGRRAGVLDGQSGTVTVVQRFGSGLELNVHYHLLGLDGVFAPGPDGTLRFHRLPPPSDADVARLVAAIARRVGRLLVRRGLADDADATDPLAAESLALAGLANAAVQGRIALGPHAGAHVQRLGADPDAPWIDASPPLQARCANFDLHAGVTVPGEDRERLEHLARYLLRPPIAQERLALAPDGAVLVTLKKAWRDGTTHLRFAPMTLLERLAALTPRPRINVLLYHGILAPRAVRRAAAVAYGRQDTVGTVADPSCGVGRSGAGVKASEGSPLHMTGCPSVPFSSTLAADVSAGDPVSVERAPASDGAPPPRRWRWAELLQRVFAVDVLACPRCGGRMRVIATLDDPAVVQHILTHLGILGGPGPPPGPWPSRT